MVGYYIDIKIHVICTDLMIKIRRREMEMSTTTKKKKVQTGSGKKIIRSSCKSCHGICGVLVTVENGRITHIKGDPQSVTRGTMCSKGIAAIQHVYNPNRILYPMKRKGKRGGCQWERISWEEALDTVANKLKNTMKEHGPRSVGVWQGTGRGYNEYTIRFSRSIGTPNFGATAHFCYAPKLAISQITVAGRLYCDYHGWGGVYPKTHVSWGKQLEITNADGEIAVWFLEALEKADNIILIDPRATRLAARANLWLKLRPGTDAALALGMMNVIINEGLYDKEFVQNWTYGFEQLRERVQEYPVDRVSQITWVPKEKIIQAARIIATQKPTAIQFGECLEASNNTVSNLRSILCLIALTGNIENPGGMVHWVPQDAGPQEEWAFEVPAPKELAIGNELYKGLQLFSLSHVDTVFRQLIEGTCEMKVLHIEGSNPMVCYANSKDVYKGLMNLDFISVADLFWSPTAELADVVLPVAHWIETDDILDMHPLFVIGAINKAVEPQGEARSDVQIFNELGKRIAPKYWFDNVEKLLDDRLKKANITWEQFSKLGFLAKTGKDQPYYKHKTDYWRKGGGFPTPSGKVELYSNVLKEWGYDPLPYYVEPVESPYSTPELYKEYPLVLSAGGRFPQYFHSQYRQVPWLRSKQPYPLVQIHPETAEKLGIKNGDWVWIESPRGRVQQVAEVFDGIDPRVVVAQPSWWYPEDPAPEHGVWRSNINVLTRNEPPFDPVFGSTQFRALLCKIYKVEDK
ncbi:MAG: molybdopterin-dependent oxidoreductase [Promethearchaeota archaeon]